MSGRIWSDGEIGFLQEHADWSAARIGEELDRTPRAVYEARRLLKSGRLGAHNKSPWTDAEDATLIEASALASAESLEALLPGRTAEAIAKRRRQLSLPVHATIGTRPFDVGGRPLVAKTCFACGLLLAGSWFSFFKKQGRWASYCRSCASVKAGSSKRRHREERPERIAARRRAEYQTLQRITLDRAKRHGEPYTEKDYEVLADQSLTDLQKALRLQRSYGAVQGARQRAGLKSAPDGLGDPERDVWVIDNPNYCPEVAA